MAQELKQIIDLLMEMKRANNTNTKSFDKLLESISNKLDLMEGSSASEELIKAYLGELTRIVNDKYTTTLAKFTDIEKALKAVYEVQNEHVQNKDLKELFTIFSKNMNGFYSEAKQQKAILSGIETKLSDFINNKSDKEDILRTITLLRGDFENLNHAYKSTIDSVNTNLKSILSNLINMDPTQTTAYIKEQVDIMYNATSEIVNYLKAIDARDTVLENLLANVATNESLKITQGVIDSIIEKSEAISKSITTLADKSSVEDLQTATAILNKKIDFSVTKEDFARITVKTDDLVSQTDEVKQTLAKVTQNIEALPDTKLLDKSLQKLFKKLDSLEKDIDKANVKGDVFDIDSKISIFKEELSTIKNIVIDLNEVIASKVIAAVNDISFKNECSDIKDYVSKMLTELPQKDDINKILLDSEKNTVVINKLIERTDALADRLDLLPTHQDIETLNSNQLSLVENLQEVANKNDIEIISAKTDDVSDMIDKLNFDEEFENLYDKSSSIERWLEDSQVKENSREILSLLPTKADQKDVLTILQTTDKIVKSLEELSQNTDAKKVTHTVSELYGMLEELKNDLINTEEMHNDSVIVHLAELKNSVANLTSGEEFADFIEDLRDFTLRVAQINQDIYGNLTENQTLQQDILERLENIDFSYVVQNINSNFEALTETIQDSIAESNRDVSRRVSDVKNRLVSISDYINTGLKLNEQEVKRSISEIKEILLNKKSNFDGIGFDRNITTASISRYLEEIKGILDASDKGLNEEVQAQFLKFESLLEQYKSFNEDKFVQIIEKLENYEKTVLNADIQPKEMTSSVEEISEISSQIGMLGKSYEVLRADNGTPEQNIASFVGAKLEELSINIEDLTKDLTSGLQQGFTYNSELIEEKSTVLLDFIKELRHASTENIELYERLTVTDSKLMDFTQQLELINTDVISNLSEKTDRMISELAPVKEMLSSLALQMPEGTQNENVKEQLGILHNSVQQDIIEGTKYSKSTFERLETAYTDIIERLSDSETSLKDFIIRDMDSLIAKVDDLEHSMEQMMPPNAEQMHEFNEFVSQINNFKEEQKEFLNKVAEDIKVTITEKMDEQHGEIKSMLTIAMNNEEIISAIEDLKKCFRSKIRDLSFAQAMNNSGDATDEFDNNEYEQVFEVSKNEKIISQIKDDFNKFSELINNLSGENQEIEDVLNSIRDKIDTITVVKLERNQDLTDAGQDESEDDDIIDIGGFSALDFDGAAEADEVLIGENNFDFIKAFDLLKQDISNLRSDIEKYLPESASIDGNSTTSADKLLLHSLSDKVDLLARSLNTDWLEEIKDYLAGNKIHSMLEEINSKIDILTLSDNSEWIDDIRTTLQQISSNDFENESTREIQSMLTLINEKIDILTTSSADFNIMDNIKDTIEDIYGKEFENQSQSNNEIKDAISNLTQKVDILAASDIGLESIDDIRDSLNTLDNKIDVIAASDNSEIMDNFQELFDSLHLKLETLASDDTKENFVEITSYLNKLEAKIDVIAASDNSEIMDNFKVLLDSLHLKLESLASDDSKENFAEITNYLNKLEAKIDVISASDNYDSLANIQDSLEAIESRLDEFSTASNNNSLEDIKYTLINVDEQIRKLSSEGAETSEVSELKQYLNSIDAKIDLIAQTDNSDELSEIQDTLIGVSEDISLLKPVDEKVQKLSEADVKITSMLEILNHKIDALATADEGQDTRESINDVKHLILAQMDYIEKFERNNKTDAFKKCLKELTLEVNNLNLNSNSTTKQLHRTLKDMKESIMSAVVTIFEQVSFVEESEDIKDFVEEKTDVINQNLEEVTKQLKQITNSADDTDYTYSMQDIESDLAKLRIALNELQNKENEAQANELSNISDKLYRITSSVEELQSSMTQDEIRDLKIDISTLQEQTQKLLITSDESYNALNSGLEDFGRMISDHLSTKVDKVTRLLEKSSDSDKVMRQALIYMGEWIDSASESMNKISTNSDEIIDMKTAIEDLKAALPEQTDILNSIEEKFDEQQERLSFFEKQISKLAGIEDKFEEQQERIDRLEMTIEKVLSAVEEIDDSKVTRKIDKIDKQLAKLSTNIEKLASYVD